MIYVLAFILSCVLALLLIPVCARIAVRLDFTDKPTERKKHAAPVPLAGGAAMFIAFTVGFIIFVVMKDFRLLSVIIGGLLILSIGLADDYYKTKGREFPVMPRILVQITAAVFTFASGIRFTGFFNPFTDSYLMLPLWLQTVLTVLWIVGLTSVINFMDGLDGLAGGLCTLAGSTLFVVALVKGQSDSALMAILLVGVSVGFLRYNLFPAKIFMGDSGANLLGYLLAVISLHGAFKQATVITVLIPVLALGVPIFDNIFVVIRRFMTHKPVYKADTGQIHYRLLKNGMNPVQAVSFIFLISACLSLTSIIILLVTHQTP